MGPNAGFSSKQSGLTVGGGRICIGFSHFRGLGNRYPIGCLKCIIYRASDHMHLGWRGAWATELVVLDDLDFKWLKNEIIFNCDLLGYLLLNKGAVLYPVNYHAKTGQLRAT